MTLTDTQKYIITSAIRDIPDFPEPGIVFKDISTLLNDKEAFKVLMDHLCDRYKTYDLDFIAGIDARGFIFGAAVAYRLGVGFIPIRKPGKLPHETMGQTYDLEYGQDTVEVHKDAVKQGDQVLVIDDVLATGGTVEAVCELLTKMGADIAGIGFLMELTFLNGIKRIEKYPVNALIKY